MSRGRRSSRRAGESDSAFAPVIVEAAAPCADVSAGRPQGSPVINIVIGAAMVRIFPGFDAVALTTVLRADENWRRDRGSGGNPIQQEAFKCGDGAK
jgi:hypothetical protein